MANHKNEKLTENVTTAGLRRWRVYLTLVLVLAGIVVATLIAIGTITQDQFEGWVLLVGITVPALIGMAGNVIALLNPEKQRPVAAPQQPTNPPPGVHGGNWTPGPDHPSNAPRDDDDYDPNLGGTPRNQV